MAFQPANDPEAALVASAPFSEEERAAVYRAIHTRRDVRDEFLPDELSEEAVMRLLDAAHHAPSVGFMQPWNFLLIRDVALRGAVHAAFERAAAAEEALLPKSAARPIKLEASGNFEGAAEYLHHLRPRAAGLDRPRAHAADRHGHSRAACAVQNLWLAARAEGVGVGWVSILREQDLRADSRHSRGDRHRRLSLRRLRRAILCAAGARDPALGPRLPLEELVFTDQWGKRANNSKG